MSEMHRKVEAILSPVYEVGGSVRDELLGIAPKDFDFTTPLPPGDVEGAIRAPANGPSWRGSGSVR
jgi:tRNA nucleotidyltransferase/poly(A) polymerase